MNETITILVTLITSIISGVIAYFTSTSQFKNELVKVKEQSKTELQKVKEQCDADIESVNKQCRTEIEKIKEQCNSDIRKIEKQSQAELQKIMTEFDKQADTYEKNKQTDVTADFFRRFMDNPQEAVTIIKDMQNLSNMFSKK